MNLPRVTYSNTGEDFSGVHAYLDEIIPMLKHAFSKIFDPVSLVAKIAPKAETSASEARSTTA